MKNTTKNSLLASSFLLIFLLSQGIASVFVLVVAHLKGNISQDTILSTTLLVANGLAIASYLLFKPKDVTAETTRQGFQYPHLNYTWLSFMMAPSVIVLLNIIQEQLPKLPNIISDDTMLSIIHNPLGCITVCILGPMAEELLFRAGLQHYLQKNFKNPWWAIIIASLVFGLIHGNPAQIPCAIGIGVLLGWSYYKTNSVLPPFFIHVANNTIACLLPDASLSDALGSTSAVIIVSFVALLWLLVMIKQAHRQLL